MMAPQVPKGGSSGSGSPRAQVPGGLPRLPRVPYPEGCHPLVRGQAAPDGDTVVLEAASAALACLGPGRLRTLFQRVVQELLQLKSLSKREILVLVFRVFTAVVTRDLIRSAAKPEDAPSEDSAQRVRFTVVKTKNSLMVGIEGLTGEVDLGEYVDNPETEYVHAVWLELPPEPRDVSGFGPVSS